MESELIFFGKDQFGFGSQLVLELDLRFDFGSLERLNGEDDSHPILVIKVPSPPKSKVGPNFS